MKKGIFFLVICLVGTLSLDAKSIAGKIISPEGVQDVIFKVPVSWNKKIVFSYINERIIYINSDQKRIKLRPRDVSEIQLNYNGKVIRLVSKSIPISKTRSVHRFLVLEQDGYVKKLKHHYTEDLVLDDSYSVSHLTDLYLQKGDNSPKRIRRGINKFKKDLLALLGDDSKIVETINRDNFRKKSLATLIDYYNRNH